MKRKISSEREHNRENIKRSPRLGKKSTARKDNVDMKVEVQKIKFEDGKNEEDENLAKKLDIIVLNPVQDPKVVA